MDKPDFLEDLLALQYVYGDETKHDQLDNKPMCKLCALPMEYDKLEATWTCIRCSL
jgi:hypothetical protein